MPSLLRPGMPFFFVSKPMRVMRKRVLTPPNSSYPTSFHADRCREPAPIHTMTRKMAGDYAKHGIRVNALCPGWVDTPFNGPFIAQMGGRGAIEGYIRASVPLGRWADVSEIAEPILFLVSDRSPYVTGQILVVDGGETIA